MLNRFRLFPVACSLLLALTASAFAAEPTELPRTSPEAQGVSSEAVLAFVDAADEKIRSMHSFMLVRNGQVVAECYWKPEAAEKPHILWSLSKSFTSTAVGFAVAEGKLKLDDKVIDFFPTEAPAEPSENLKAMTVRDLLTMATGHTSEPNVRSSEHWRKMFLAHPVEEQPGSHFLYNTAATYMQSAIVQKVTGETVLDYLQPRLFDPLGIEKPQWGSSPEGVTLGGYGLYLKTGDIAKFGQLYLQKGKWNGKQIVPAEWIGQATSKQVENAKDPASVKTSDWAQGYGFQFWRSRHGAYRGDGKDGQFCLVIPEENAVIVMTADTGDMQGQLNLVWEHLLPALDDEALPENPEAQKKLEERCEDLTAKPR
ncbi:MAG TPA: serine hydrolase [Pirellulaceae bacterium]|jgi:CubicO group peptidase (beta-lactamase class C family)|nr:serine hydrolase [Pirellulaceae bacterium]